MASDYARSPQTMSPWGRLRTGSSQDQPEMSHPSYVRRRTRSQPTNGGPTHPVGGGGDPSCLVVQTRQREQGCCWQLVFPGRIYEGGPGVLGAPPDTTHRPVESIRPRVGETRGERRPRCGYGSPMGRKNGEPEGSRASYRRSRGRRGSVPARRAGRGHGRGAGRLRPRGPRPGAGKRPPGHAVNAGGSPVGSRGRLRAP